MSDHTTVLYPNNEDATFDESYYVKDHMPRVKGVWKKHGLLDWKVIKSETSMDGSRHKYLITTLLVWENEEAVKRALQDPETPKLFADGPNYTNTQPITLAGVFL